MSSPTESYTRKGVNVMADGRIYQRGQIMTWSLEEKREFFKKYDIRMVVNFWSKLDADMSECDIQYIYVPTPHSKNMLDVCNYVLAEYIAKWLQLNTGTDGGDNVLVLCEAGKTRSVFFCVLLVSYYMEIGLRVALKHVEEAVPNHRMKQFMLDHIKE